MLGANQLRLLARPPPPDYRLRMLTPAQCRAARALLGLTQQQLADAAGVSEATVVDLEKRRRQVSEETQRVIRRALERAGVEFIEENGGGVGARLKRR